MRVLACINQKGGVAKTTSALNIAAAIAMLEENKKVVILDLDPQCSLTISLGFEPEDFASSIGDVFNSRKSIKEVVFNSGLLDNLFIIPAAPTLSATAIDLSKMKNGYLELSELLYDLDGIIDYVIIDCPPELSMLTISALAASTDYIVPCECEYLAFRGIKQLKQTVSDIEKMTDSKINDLGVIATKYSMREKDQRLMLELLKKDYNVVSIIKKTTKIKSGLYDGKPVVAALPKSDVAIAYKELAQYILNNTTNS